MAKAEWITVAEAAELLGVQPFRVLEVIKERKWKTEKAETGRGYLVKTSDVEFYKENRRVGRPAAGPKAGKAGKGAKKGKSKKVKATQTTLPEPEAEPA